MPQMHRWPRRCSGRAVTTDLLIRRAASRWNCSCASESAACTASGLQPQPGAGDLLFEFGFTEAVQALAGLPVVAPVDLHQHIGALVLARLPFVGDPLEDLAGLAFFVHRPVAD